MLVTRPALLSCLMWIAFPSVFARRGGHGSLRRAAHVPRQLTNDVLYTAAGPGIHDLNNSTAPQVQDPDVKAILYALSKCTFGHWIIDLMGQRVPQNSTEPIVPYSNTTASFAIFDSEYTRSQVTIPISGAGPQWAVGYEKAWQQSKTTPKILPDGASWTPEQILRSISGFPTRRIMPWEVTSTEDTLWTFVIRADETPMLAYGNGTTITKGAWVMTHAQKDKKFLDLYHATDDQFLPNIEMSRLKNEVEFFITFADFERWTPSIFPWHAVL